MTHARAKIDRMLRGTRGFSNLALGLVRSGESLAGSDAELSNVLATQVSIPPNHLEAPMYVVRELMYCKPGKVRPMVEKFLAMSKLGERVGMPTMRVMTDFTAERYWTVVAEMEVPTLQALEDMMSNPQGSPEDLKEFENLMKGYHELVDYGKREIYKVEG